MQITTGIPQNDHFFRFKYLLHLLITIRRMEIKLTNIIPTQFYPFFLIKKGYNQTYDHCRIKVIFTEIC